MISRELFELKILWKPGKTKNYSKSLRLGFREGSLERKPKINKEMKNIIVVYTKIFKVNIKFFLGTISNIINYTKIFKI